MKAKSITFLFAYLILLSFMLVEAAMAWECPQPPPSGCYTCQDGVWVKYGNCWAGCPVCNSCQSCWCTWACGTGVCCNGSCCPAGKFCINNECKDCRTDSDCLDCQKCEDNECVNCKCWDAGDAITGTITVQDAEICECVTHTSNITDFDHWIDGSGNEGYSSDTITYLWAAFRWNMARRSASKF